MSVEVYAIGAALLSIAFALYLSWTVKQFPAGEGKMLEIAEAIREGAKAFLNRQYKTVGYVAVVVAADRDNVVMEAMSAITNAFNMAHQGTYKDLQMVAPDGQWRESFWVKTSGF